MYEVCLVLELFVYALDDVPLAEHEFVPHKHEPVCFVMFLFSTINIQNIGDITDFFLTFLIPNTRK